MIYSKGISWFDDARIPFKDGGDKDSAKPLGKTLKHKGWDTEKWLEETKEPDNRGRFPPNLLVCDDMLNDGSVGGGGSFSGIKKRTRIRYFKDRDTMDNEANSPDNYGDKGTNSRYYDLDKWFEKVIIEL